MRPHTLNRAYARGFSLVELMIALTIGSILIAGAVYVYSQTRTTYTVNDSTGRMQEEARYALSLLEPDIQLAGFYGYTNSYGDVQLVIGGAATPVVQVQQSDPPAAGLLGAATACGQNFAVDLMATLQGSDNSFVLGPGANAPGAGSGCAIKTPLIATPTTTPDTLTMRRVSTGSVPLEANRLQVYINRLQPTAQQMFVDGVAPGALIAGQREIRNLIVRSYYVSQDTDGRPGYPALRVISLGSGEAFTDLEIVPGVEDLQVQFGVDTGDYDANGTIDNDADGNGIADSANGVATRYVNPNDVILQPPTVPGGHSAQVVTVRLWLRLRADQPETGFQDTRRYQYANIDYTPAGAAASFRRMVVTRTIYLRNARTL